MNAQCNSCGGFFGIEKCQTCNTLICERCRTNHEIGCGQAQNMKTLGLGPTVRTAIPVLIPVEPTEFPKNAYSEASAELVATVVGVSPEVIPETAVNHAGVVIVTDAPLSFEIPATIQEPINESLSETILPQEQATEAVFVNQGLPEHSEQSPSLGGHDSGITDGASIAVGSDGDGAGTAVEAVNATDAGSLSDALGSDILGK